MPHRQGLWHDNVVLDQAGNPIGLKNPSTDRKPIEVRGYIFEWKELSSRSVLRGHYSCPDLKDRYGEGPMLFPPVQEGGPWLFYKFSNVDYDVCGTREEVIASLEEGLSKLPPRKERNKSL